MYTYIYIYIKSRVDIPNGRSVGPPANWATVAPLRLVDGVSKHWGCLVVLNRLGDGVSKRIDVLHHCLCVSFFEHTSALAHCLPDGIGGPGWN